MKVFLYGHYDSRGGTTAIEADTKEEADERYNREALRSVSNFIRLTIATLQELGVDDAQWIKEMEEDELKEIKRIEFGKEK